jgi:hypothetical protein
LAVGAASRGDGAGGCTQPETRGREIFYLNRA